MADDNKPDPAAGTPAERPDWLPERYETPEQLAKAYAEAERKITELSERAKQADSLEENYAALSAQVEQLQQTQTQQQTGAADPLIAAYGAAIEQGDYASALAIQAQVGQIAAAAEVQRALPQVNQRVDQLGQSQQQEIANAAANSLRAQYGDFNEAEPAMRAILDANPNLYPESAHYDVNASRAAYENIYKLATYGKQPAAASALDTTQMKELAQTAQGAGGRALTPDQEKEEWDAIKASGQRGWADGR